MRSYREPGRVFFGESAAAERNRLLSCLRGARLPEHDISAIALAYPVEEEHVPLYNRWRVPAHEELSVAAGRSEGDYHPDILNGILLYEG
ncbi:MAG: hypothetical protein HYY37_05605 [Candidatus Aenigmarchaeota archaeon]|nr:hypothetical protein [Candidatus Aenigmarchaeota archaeon]